MGNCTMGWYLVDTLFLLSLIYSSELGKNQVLFREMKLAHAQTYCIYTYHMHHVRSYTVRCTHTDKDKDKVLQSDTVRQAQSDRQTHYRQIHYRQANTDMHTWKDTQTGTHQLTYRDWHTGSDIHRLTSRCRKMLADRYWQTERPWSRHIDKDRDIQIHTDWPVCRYIHKSWYTQTYIIAYIHIHTYTNIQTYRCIHTCRHTGRNTDMGIYTDKHIHRRRHTQADILRQTHTQTNTFTDRNKEWGMRFIANF